MNQDNPYSTPEAGPLEQPEKVGKLYSQNQVLAATFFGSIVSGALLLKHNFTAKKDRATGNVVFYSSIIALALLIALTWNVSEKADRMISKLFIAAGMLTMYAIYRYHLKSDFEKHVKNGDAVMSNWMVVLAIVKIIGIFILLIVGWVGYEVFINGEEL